MVCLHISVNFFIKVLASKEKSFASGQKPFASGLQVKKTLCNWFANGLQVVQKPFASGLLASKPMQILSTLHITNITTDMNIKNILMIN